MINLVNPRVNSRVNPRVNQRERGRGFIPGQWKTFGPGKYNLNKTSSYSKPKKKYRPKIRRKLKPASIKLFQKLKFNKRFKKTKAKFLKPTLGPKNLFLKFIAITGGEQIFLTTLVILKKKNKN